MDVDVEDLRAAEPWWDEQVIHLPALTMQRETLLIYLYNLIWLLNSGGLRGTEPQERAAARSTAARISLIPHLLLRAPAGRTFSSQAEAASAASSEQARSVSGLLAYAHLSEVMPDVHRGNYVVTDTGRRMTRHPVTGADRDLMTFRLDYPDDDEWAEIDALDMALRALATPRTVSAPHASPHRLRTALSAWGQSDLGPGARLIARFAEHYRTSVHESGLLDDDGLHNAIGVDTRTFRRFRAALMGLAEWGLQNADLLQRDIRLSGATEDRASELFDWTAMSVNAAWIENLLAHTSGASPATVRGILEVFSLGGYTRATAVASNTGGGFYPPLARFGSQVLFSPHILLSALTDRNVAFALNGLDRDHFEREVSEHLESKLLADMSAVMQKDPSVDVVTGVRWRSGGRQGEIDAVVARRGRLGVLHFQAKGAIPPSGSRSTQHVETRVHEGLRQCRSFAELPSSEQDRILTTALGRPVVGEPLIGVVLVRTNVGTPRAWRQAGDVTLLTLPLLRAAVNSQLRDDGAITPAAIPAAASQALDDLRRRIVRTVHHEFNDLYWVGLDLPVRDWDDLELLRIAASWGS